MSRHIYYHVDRLETKLTEGMTVELHHTHDLKNDPRLAAQLIVSIWPNGLSDHGANYLGKPHTMNPSQPAALDVSAAIDVIFELVRLAHYQQCPSRLQSLFACRTLNEAEKFALNYLASGKQSGANKATIWSVETEREGFFADMAWLNVGRYWFDLVANAHEYWKGNATANPIWEVLLVPPVHVTGRVKVVV